MSGGTGATGEDNGAVSGGRRVIDITVAHSARVHDYWLGGKDNFAVDRAVGDEVMAAYPGIVKSVRAGRAFLARVVRFLAAEAGIRQFLDIGTGIPAANNTHEVAQAAASSCRIVYVDYDPVVLRHAQALLAQLDAGCHRLHRSRPAQPAADPRAGGTNTGLLPAGRGHADRHHAPDRRPGRPARNRPAATWRCRRWPPISSLNRWPRGPGGTTGARGRPSTIAATPRSCASSTA
jgi:hypothetical protein